MKIFIKSLEGQNNLISNPKLNKDLNNIMGFRNIVLRFIYFY